MGDGGARFMLSGDTAFHAGQRKCMHAQMYKGNWEVNIKAFYAQITDKLIEEKSYKLAGKNFVDIIRDVGNIGPVHFASRKYAPDPSLATRHLVLMEDGERHVQPSAQDQGQP